MCSKKGLQVAFVELSIAAQIQELSDSGDGEKNCFCLAEIDFYPSCTLAMVQKIRQMNYDCLVFDFGVLSPSTCQTFLQCNKKFIIGSICPWKSRHTWDCFVTYKIQFIDSENIVFLGNLGIKEDVFYWKRHYHQSVCPVPFIAQPFHLTVSDWKFIDQLF